MKIKMTLVSLVLCVTTFAVSAQVTLPPVFADGMVLQQKSKAALWGKATPNAQISVKSSWNDKTTTTKAGKDSLWRVHIETPAGSFKPYNITITTAGKSVELKDVLIGEVWLCGGQSNMEMPVNGFRNQPNFNSQADVANSTNDFLRIYSVKRNSTVRRVFDATGEWVKASPNTTGAVSATGYYFGRMLQKALDIPVGLLVCCYGGTQIENWIPEEALSVDFPSKVIPKTDKEIKSTSNAPTVLYNSMMYSIEGYDIKGAIWYQGESNRKNFAEYAKLFEVMHKAWEKRWGIGEFPIYLAQIAPFDYAPRGEVSNLAFMREAQASIPKTQKNTGIAILLDLGEQNIIHPARKQQVGERLAFQALNKSYGFTKLHCDSPEMKNVKFDADKATVTFDKVPMGLYAKGELSGFELAGEDRVFHPATAKVENFSTVSVVSGAVPKPVAVRYCFKSFVDGSLYGGNNLPASSFRSDDWNDVL